MKILLQGGQLADGTACDIEISNGVITEIGKVSGKGIDCSGLIYLPGFVDLHAHLREPGFEGSETILTGSMSGAAGGYTALLAMANTEPVADNPGVVEQVYDLGRKAGYLEVQPVGAITKGLQGLELSAMAAMNKSRARVRYFSDDGNCVSDPMVMRRALEYVAAFDGVIAQHCQDPRLTPDAQMNEGSIATELGLTGWTSVAEESIIARDALLAEKTGSRLHICHVTTAGGVEIIRWAKKRGIRITAEVTPHHLLLTEELVRGYDPVYKVNPPLRSQEDTIALREALIDGTIDALATDHAPHAIEKKDCEWQNAAFGMVGLESAASVLYQVLVKDGGRSWRDFAKVISTTPAKIAGLGNQGRLEIGGAANLAVFDPAGTNSMSLSTYSKSRNNPLAGRKLNGKVVHTIFNGRFTNRNSEVISLDL